MTSNLATYQPNELAPAGMMGQSAPHAIAALDQHVQAMQKANQLAIALCGTSMVPAAYRGKPDDGTAAILYGAELGLNPIAALQNVVVIHGKPSVEARTMTALLQARGYIIATLEETDQSVTVAGEAPNGNTYQATWTIERAIQAGYVPTKDDRGNWKKNDSGKLLGNMKYITDPQAMLWAKAAAQVCRRLAPEVLLGIAYATEDLDYVDATVVDATVQVQQPARRGRGIAALKERLAGQPAAVEAAEPEQPAVEEPPAPAQAEATPATAEQRKQLNALMETEGLTTPEAKAEWLGNACHRDIGKPGTKTALRADEAQELISYLAQAQADDAERAAQEAQQ